MRQRGGSDTAIVFVHGVFGDGDATWRNGAIYWPKLLESDPVFNGADIFVHDFPSPHLAPSLTIGQLADHLRLRLDANKVFQRHRRVVFLCHSMGGLIVRAFLLRYREFADQVPMIYFFSTPTTGSGIAHLAGAFSQNPTLKQMKPVGTNDPGALPNWQDDWASSGYAKTIRSYCAYELQKTFGVRVVEKESATSLCTERYDPIDRDHLRIVKPAGPDDEVYQAFQTAYEETLGRPATSSLIFQPKERPTWNLVAYEHALLRIRNEMRGTYCDNCQGTHIGAAPGDVITVTIHYRNDSGETAHNTRVRLTVPTEPFSGQETFTATLASDNAQPGFGKVWLDVENDLIVLVPEGKAQWYINKSTEAASLPDNQGIIELLKPEGLALGDVNPGAPFQGDIVMRFRCVPVVVRAVKNAIREVAPIAETTSILDEKQFASAFRKAAETMCGNIEHDVLRGPMWVDTVSDLRPDDDLTIVVSHYNMKPTPLRNVKVFLRFDEANSGDLQVEITAGGQLVSSGIVHLKFATDVQHLTFVMASHIRHTQEKSLRAIMGSASLPRGDPHRGFEIGDIGPRTSMMVNGIFVVVEDPDDTPTEDDRAVIAEGFEHARAMLSPYDEVRTTLNGEATDVTVQVATPGYEEWTDHYDALKEGDRLEFKVRYRVTGSVAANDLYARLTFEETGTDLLAHAQLEAANADPVSAGVRLGCASSCANLTLKLVAAEWHYAESPVPVPVDAAIIATTGLWLGDRASQDSGNVLLHYEVVRSR